MMSNKFHYCSKTFIVFFSLLVFTAFNSYSQPTEHRNIMLINEGWKFTDKPAVDPFKKKYDDSKWNNIKLPHCWNTTDPYEDDNEYLRGICKFGNRECLAHVLVGDNKLTSTAPVKFSSELSDSLVSGPA
mgnify:CR=1 FL=1